MHPYNFPSQSVQDCFQNICKQKSMYSSLGDFLDIFWIFQNSGCPKIWILLDISPDILDILFLDIPKFQIWLVVGPPLWKIWVRQLGWLETQYMGKSSKCSKPDISGTIIPIFYFPYIGMIIPIITNIIPDTEFPIWTTNQKSSPVQIPPEPRSTPWCFSRPRTSASINACSKGRTTSYGQFEYGKF